MPFYVITKTETETVKNYGIFKKGRELSVLAEPDADGTFHLLALGYQRLDGHLIAQDDTAALKHAAGIPHDTDNILLALMVVAKSSQH